MSRMLMAIALGVAAAAGTAIAQDGPPGGTMGMMMRADTNGDGTITRAEYQAQVAARFARRDTNGNGRIDEGERPRGRSMRRDGPPPPATGAAPPSRPPSDIGLTRELAGARAMERFDRLDANHDGRIDAAEMRAAMPMPAGPPPAG